MAETVSWLGVKLHVAPEGSPLQLSETVPVNELVGATLMIKPADEPIVTLATCDDALRLNVGVEEADVEFAMTPNSPCCSPPIPAVK